jgi:hypothetical protein
MSRLIDTLPGVSMSVEAVTDTLRHMWDVDATVEDNPLGYRSSQLNLILHFGLATTPEEAKGHFDTAIQFAQRYPCRVIVLCPSQDEKDQEGFNGKLYSQCFIGKHMRDLCCCEALILGYSPDHADYLKSQVSTWIESDLPVYHWLHRVPADRITRHHLSFLSRCKGVLFDGEVEGDEYDQIDWPSRPRVTDLAKARTLPLRQSLGQFLSGHPKNELVEGLKTLRFQYTIGMRRQAFNLMRWHKEAIARCFKRPADVDSVVFTFEQLVQENSDSCLRIDWEYANPDSYIKWSYNRSRKTGLILSSLPSGAFEHPFHIEALSPEAALSEAMFFG